MLAGPYCGMLLGDLGADVVKVERPGVGDDTRQWGPPFLGDQSAYFLCTNRNKRSITLNLRHEEGQRIARELALASDVLIENFLPGTLEGWGLGYAALSALNPRLVYCSITGFGQDGPYRDLPGYDILIQGAAGIMSITGEPDGPPMKVGVAISDITAGLFASNAILAALVGRGTSGQGRYIDISLLDSTVAWLANVGANYLATGRVPERLGNAHANIVPYQAFATGEGTIIVAVGNDDQWQRFCRAVERADLAGDPRYATNPLRVRNRDALIPELEALLTRRRADEWLARLEQAEVPCGPVNTLDQVFEDPQVQARRLLLDLPHPTAGSIRLVGPPWKLTPADAAAANHRPPPCLGQHTEEVLAEWLGTAANEIATLRSCGTV